MIRSYWRSFKRALTRAALYLGLSSASLSIGYSVAALIICYVLHETTFDTYHENYGRIFRLVNNGETRLSSKWTEDLSKQFPEISATVRFINYQDLQDHEARTLVEYDGRKFAEAKFAYADKNVLDVFTWPLISGTKETALQKPFTIVVSKSMALKYFGDADPIGLILTVYRGDEKPFGYEVTGVYEDFPNSSHLTYDFIASIDSYLQMHPAADFPWSQDAWSWTYLMLNDANAAKGLAEKLPTYLKGKMGDNIDVKALDLQPLASIHLSEMGTDNFFHEDLTFMYVLVLVAGLILASSILNFTNLFTTYAQRRLREIGMRKTFGASSSQVTAQFIGEAMTLNLAGAAMALLMIYAAAPFVSEITGVQLTMKKIFTVEFSVTAIVIVLAVGFTAGLISSVPLSRTRVSKIFRQDETSFFRVGNIRKLLMTFQFAISVALIFSTLVIVKQVDFLQSTKLGFNTERIIVLPLNGAAEVESKPELFQNDVLTIAGVKDICYSHSLPGQFLRTDYYRKDGEIDSTRTSEVLVDGRFVNFFGVDLLAGRTFENKWPSDSATFVINEAAVKHFGFKSAEEALGNRIEKVNRFFSRKGPIVGVVDNFHYQSLHHQVAPTVFWVIPRYYNYVSIRLESNANADVIQQIEATWNRHEQVHPFEYYFLDDQMKVRYVGEESIGKLIGYASILAAVIGCMGLFGLASYDLTNRQKEIGIRKTLGAGVGSIVQMFTLRYLKTAVIACAVALPVSYYIMSTWLDGFPYHASIGVGLMTVAAGAACVLVLISVASQVAKTASTDPVKTLRKE